MSAKTAKDERRTRYIKQLDDDLTSLTKRCADLVEDHRKLKGATFDTFNALENRVIRNYETAKTDDQHIRATLDSITQADNAARKEFAAEFMETRKDINNRLNAAIAFLRLPWYKRLFRRFK